MQTNLLPLTIPDCRPVITSSINFCGVSKNYLVNVVHKHLFATITNCMKRNDSNLNKKNPNLVETRLVHLHMRARVRGEFAGLMERAVQAERLQYASRASTVLQTCRDASYEACGSCKK
ncbi:hypothetical protein DPMN_172449 [Dreissena polymorpha]|uniref:Uncharacterized protein n=1 Tax=Dreissena polymorpha TaxID=45954 RepID=A0A9D4DZV9_DREPO|nr:hypothetical protein DPMN_172449 [Dreissena polymorpha]